MSQITVVALIRAKNGRSDDLGAALNDLVEPSRAEDGCINYDIHRSLDDPELWVVYENWRSPDDLDRHFTLPHLETFLAVLPELVDGELDIRRCSMRSKPALWKGIPPP